MRGVACALGRVSVGGGVFAVQRPHESLHVPSMNPLFTSHCSSSAHCQQRASSSLQHFAPAGQGLSSGRVVGGHLSVVRAGHLS